LPKSPAITRCLGLQEEAKSLPMGSIWDYYCETQSVPVGPRWLREVERYEKEILSRRV
jgi:L-rhamnose isomerase